MTPGRETAAGFFVGLMRGPDVIKKVAAAPHSVSANRGVLLFFIVIFYRCLRETIEVDCARTRPQVAGAEPNGCGHARS